MGLNPILYNLVKETSTTTGTGAYMLAGAVSTYLAFSGALADGDKVVYHAYEVDGNGNRSGGWEIGWGTFTLSGTTLSRDFILNSSNSNNAVSWSSGTRRVEITRADNWGFDFPFLPPTLQSWTWANQGSATIATQGKGIFLRSPNGAGLSLSYYYISAPSAPYKLDVAALLLPSINNFGTSDQIFTYPITISDGTKLTGFGQFMSNDAMGVDDWNSVTSFNAAAFASNPTNSSFAGGYLINPVFLRFTDNNTNHIFSISADGQNYFDIWSRSRTAFLSSGGNRIGIAACGRNSSDAGLLLKSFWVR